MRLRKSWWSTYVYTTHKTNVGRLMFNLFFVFFFLRKVYSAFFFVGWPIIFIFIHRVTLDEYTKRDGNEHGKIINFLLIFAYTK